MKKWIIVICVILVLGLAAVGTCALLWEKNTPALQLTVLGDTEITLEYGESFVDPGAEGFFQGQVFCKEGLQVPVRVTGAVDTSKTGTYTLEYSATVYTNYFSIEQEHTAAATRTVHVVDTQAPVITLFSQDGHYTLPGHPYEEEGFAASDNYDGDLTDLVQCSQEGGILTYSVSDSSGNTATAQRYIYYNDPEPPVLTLLGDAIVLHPQGEEYIDPGYTVEDNCDTDLACTVTGLPDVNKPGIYELTYTVTDTFGNQDTASRRVVVRAKTVWPAPKTIYLTFDDGPSGYTPYLLDVLKKYNVKATFFVVDTSRIYLVERMVAEGHKVALHTASHDYSKLYASEEAYFEDLNQVREAVAKYTDQPLTLIRFPGGSSNTVSRKYCEGIMTNLAQRIAEEGYYYFDWNVDSHDASDAFTTEEVYQRVIDGISRREFSMVLMHDIKGYSVDAVEAIIVWALENGYRFRTIDETTPGFHANIRN